jgi:hypothetical protein
MAKDIEEFLRMAAARRREAAGSPPVQPPPDPQPVPRSPSQPPRSTSKPPRKSSKPPVIVADDEVELIVPGRESVARHVEKHLDTSQLKRHAEQLGEKVGRADEKLQEHLHQKFDHQLGSLAKKPVMTTAETEASADRRTPRSLLQRMLATPQSIQQAIVLNEVLKRPEWD